jgi:lipid II:glycine glycyltransferase (peptidoglycan interpeptide bridge formation enzyme)
MNIKNKKQPEGGLLQSKYWMDLLRAEDKRVVTICDNVNGVVNKLSIVGDYLYLPRAYATPDKIQCFIEELTELNVGWVRLDILNDEILKKFDINNIKYKKAPHDMQPKENFIIDITKTEDELLSQMKSKTRYNVRLANRKGVKVIVTRDKEYIDIFCDLVEQTANRKDINFHNRKHYYKMFEKIPQDILQLYVAKYKNEVVATNIVAFYGGVGTYLHGATSDRHRNVMAPFLLQWNAIKDAKHKKCHWYDFGGIFEDTDSPGKAGITRFKKGFAPDEKMFKTKGSYDIVISKMKYKIYDLIQIIK